MSKSDLLYVRNMTLSESEKDDDGDIWDDRKLNDAYDKALSIANAEVAKRLAMSTNTQNLKDGSKVPIKKPTSPTPAMSQKRERKNWKAGMHCRAVYEGDGIEYEAFLMRVINDKECVVRFMGYDNTEIVPISTLKQSLGKRERTQQIDEALAENLGEGFSNKAHTTEDMDCSDQSPTPASVASQSKKKKNTKKTKPKAYGCQLPDIPTMPMPNLAQLRNIGVMDMPIPPPPPLSLPRHEVESEDQAVSSMLLSWYMSGYYTGLYQGMKRAREGKNQ